VRAASTPGSRWTSRRRWRGRRRKEAITDFLELYRESEGAVIALDAGVRATRLDTALIDPKILDVDRITRSRVASVYNMPPHLRGDYSSSGYASTSSR
jgi:phage portal protein BeeE